MAEKTARTCIAGARVMLEHARQGQRDFEEGRDRRLSGLYAAVTSARSVTFALQNMRGHVDGFEPWYEGVQEALKADPVCAWFVKLRNRVEKQGTHGESSSRSTITYMDGGVHAELMRLAPVGTIGIFVGEAVLGRSGWRVQLPDGDTQDVYFTLPAHVGAADLHLEDAPGGRGAGELLAEQLETLERIVADAEATFL